MSIETVTFIGYDVKWLRQVSLSSLSSLYHKIAAPVPSLKLLVVSPDEVMRLYTIRFSILQNHDHLIKNLQVIINNIIVLIIIIIIVIIIIFMIVFWSMVESISHTIPSEVPGCR